MEVHLTPEQQAQLAQIATKAGTVPERLATNVVARYLDEETRFLAAVEKGIAAAERGEFIEEEEMDARLEAPCSRSDAHTLDRPRSRRSTEHQELFATELPAFRRADRADNLPAYPLAENLTYSVPQNAVNVL